MYKHAYMTHKIADMVGCKLGSYVIMMSKTADYFGYSLDSYRLIWTFKYILVDTSNAPMMPKNAV